MQLLQLPPGFRFHPTDEELIMFYLRSQVTSMPCPASIIPEIDIYKFDPWELPDKATEFGEKEWYFFSRRERKYPNGVRPNRAAVSGYWKATGTDKPIYSKGCVVGVKKGLVFYKGKPPKGVKTDWIMHEFRLLDNGPIRLEDWVLCRIYRKRHVAAGRNYVNVEEMETSCNTSQLQLDESASAAKKDDDDDDDDEEEEMLKIPRNTSFSHLFELDYCMGMGSISHLFSDNSYNPASDFQTIMGDNNSC